MNRSHPFKKLSEKDNAANYIALGIYHNQIIMQFEHDTGWVGFTKQQAKNLAEQLIELSEKLKSECN